MHQLNRPPSPVARLAERFVVDRRLLRPGAVIEGADVGRPGRPAVRVHVLDTRQTEGLEESLEAWELAHDSGLPVAPVLETIAVDGLTCVILDRVVPSQPVGPAQRAAAAAEAGIVGTALADRGVRVDRLHPSSVGLDPERQLVFSCPPLGELGQDDVAPSPAAQVAPLVQHLRHEDAATDAFEELPRIATPRPGGSRRVPPAGRPPRLDGARLRAVARGHLIVRFSLAAIALAALVLVLANRSEEHAVEPAPLALTQQPVSAVATPAMSTPKALNKPPRHARAKSPTPSRGVGTSEHSRASRAPAAPAPRAAKAPKRQRRQPARPKAIRSAPRTTRAAPLPPPPPPPGHHTSVPANPFGTL